MLDVTIEPTVRGGSFGFCLHFGSRPFRVSWRLDGKSLIWRHRWPLGMILAQCHRPALEAGPPGELWFLVGMATSGKSNSSHTGGTFFLTERSMIRSLNCHGRV